MEEKVEQKNGILLPDEKPRELFFERATRFIGSTASLILHTIFFAGSFALAFLGYAAWDTMLLVLTTVVSLEAIYLAIFIQMTVNQHAVSLREVEEDVEDIQENVEEISEEIEDLGEDVEEIQEDIEEMSEDEDADTERKKQQAVTLEVLTKDVRRVLEDLEKFKKQ